jgi:hypothetical protein
MQAHGTWYSIEGNPYLYQPSGQAGAGASKGAGHILPYDHPLGTEVYDRLAEHFPTEWGLGYQLSRYSEGLC